ncbi:MAG: FAD-binding oxidoreductase [Chloroflexota bacterium]
MQTYDILVIGRGLIGSAAARHLSNKGATVALIGPGEPDNHQTHTGVFGSHYDSGRIVRILDPIPYYAHIAKQSIQRFRALEAQTNTRFYHEVGYLVVSNNITYLDDMEACAQAYYPTIEQIPYPDLSLRFPYFHFPTDVKALYQATAGGYLNPRQTIAAQNKALEMQGGTVIDDTVLELNRTGPLVQARTTQGWVAGHKVVLATGAFANVGGITPRAIDFGVVPHTTVLGKVSIGQLDSLAGMPSLSYRLGDDPMRFIYFMPPIQYPDGNYYIKIGHSKGDSISNDKESLTTWFQGDGDPNRIAWLTETLHNLLPEVQFSSFHSQACVTTQSPTGKQFIDRFEDERIYSLLADNGQCAKSADELGYIAASFVEQGCLPEGYDVEDYRLVYAE